MACGVFVVVGREEDVSSVEEGRLLGRREVGSLAMLMGLTVPGMEVGSSLRFSYFNTIFMS